MKKITTKLAGYRLGITLSIILSITTFGRSQSPYSFDELVIRFQTGTSTGYIDSLRQYYNAIENSSISPSPVSDIHLWRITQFPTGGSNNLNDIKEVVGDARGRAKVESVGLNYDSNIFSFDYEGDFIPDVLDPTYLCENDFSITCDVADAEVRIAILDTGIGYYLSESNTPVFYSPGLFTPFYSSYIGYDFANRDPVPRDDHGHGTHIAGIIAEIATMAEANTIQLKSFKTHNASGMGKIFDIILAVDRSILDSINIINMSFSYQAPPPTTEVEPLEYAINLAGDHGILVVAAAGNDSHDNDMIAAPSYPASFTCDNIITITSVNCDKDLSAFSNWGEESVDIATLGEDIIAPNHIGTLVAKSGTSQAAGMTSGIAGLLATNLTTINWLPIKCSIIDGAEYSPNLQNLILTEGIVNAEDAYNELMGNCGLGYRSESMIAEENKPDFNQMSVYPNPFSEYCTIKCRMKTADEVTVNVYNAVGQLIYNTESQLDEGTHLLKWFPENNIPVGVYFIQTQTNNEEVTRKVVKQH